MTSATLYQLSPQHHTILRSLARLGSATPSELELQTGMIGVDLTGDLDELKKLGLVKSSPTSSGFDRELYVPSAKALDLLR